MIAYLTTINTKGTVAHCIQTKMMCESFINNNLMVYYLNASNKISKLLFIVKTLFRIDKKTTIYCREFLICILALFFSRNTFYEIHLFRTSLIKKLLINFFSNKIVLIYISDELKKLYYNEYVNCKSEVLHDAANFNEGEVIDLKKIFNINTNLPIILHTGSLYKINMNDFHEILCNDYFILHIGDTLDKCNVLNNEFNAYRDKIKFVPYVPHAIIMAAQRSADALLYLIDKNHYMASYTSPLKIFEYLMVNKPILSCDSKSIREINTSNIFFYTKDNLRYFKFFLESFKPQTDVSMFTWDYRVNFINKFNRYYFNA